MAHSRNTTGKKQDQICNIYNATLLSELYKKYKMEKNIEWCDLIKRLSPVAWQHINLSGKYDFCQNQKSVNIQDVIENVRDDLKINYH